MQSEDSRKPALRAKPAYSLNSLRSEIFSSDSPESLVRSLPAQTVYMALKESGISSAVDLFEIATIEQRRTFLDLDLWSKDSVNEDNFWEWLAMPDEADSLEVLQQVVSVIDLKIIAYFISKYVEVEITEEPTDAPPGPEFHTPDKGSTWLKVNNDSDERRFYLSRLLALLFETNTELFYQLISLRSTTTESDLQEQGYLDKSKRLAAEGIPEDEYANELCSVLTRQQAAKLINTETFLPPKDVPILSPLIYDPDQLQPLTGFLQELNNIDDISSELSLLMNAAIVSWRIDFSDSSLVAYTTHKVRGLLNIGLEAVKTETDASSTEIYQSLGLKTLFRVGISEAKSLQPLINELKSSEEELFVKNKELLIALDCVVKLVPEFPSFLCEQKANPGEIKTIHRPLENLAEVSKLRDFLDKEIRELTSK